MTGKEDIDFDIIHTFKSLTQVQGFQKASPQIKQPIELLLTQNQQMIANIMGIMKQLTT